MRKGRVMTMNAWKMVSDPDGDECQKRKMVSDSHGNEYIENGE